MKFQIFPIVHIQNAQAKDKIFVKDEQKRKLKKFFKKIKKWLEIPV
jgi:hypothetical protein